MTIARRLLLLLAVPLLILGGLGFLVRHHLEGIEQRSRFDAEKQIRSLAVLGNIIRTYTEMRVSVRAGLLAEDAARLAECAAELEGESAKLDRLLREFADGLVSDERDRAPSITSSTCRPC